MRVRASLRLRRRAPRPARRSAPRPGSSAIASSAPSTCASCGSRPAIGSRKSPSALEQPHHVGADAGRRPKIDDLHRDAAADPIEPPDPLLDRSPASTAGRTARAGGRTRSCALRRRTPSRSAGWGRPRSRNRATSMSRRAGRQSSWNTPVASCARALSASAASRASRDGRRTPVSSRLPAASAAACVTSQASRGIGGVHRLGQLRVVRSRRGRARPRAPRRTPARDGCDRSCVALETGSSARRRAAPEVAHRAEHVDAAVAGGRSIAIGAAGRQTADVDSPRRAGARRQRHAGASRASTSCPPGNSSGRSSCSNRKNPCASSSSGVALRSRTCRPSAAIGATARQAGSPGWPGGRRSRCASSTTSRSMPARTACSVNSRPLRSASRAPPPPGDEHRTD